MKHFRLYSFLALVIIISLALGSGCSTATKAGEKPSAPTVPSSPAAAPSTPVAPVTVTSTGTPDLVITDIQLDGLQVKYRVKNVGNGDSTPTYSYLYVNDIMPALGGDSYVEALKPGQENLSAFTNYQWEFGKEFGPVVAQEKVNSAGYIELPLNNSKVKVCADAKNELKESNKSNNCKVTLVGILWDNDMLSNFNLANWRNGDGDIPEPGSEKSAAGAHYKLITGSTDTLTQLVTIPQQVPNGWIQGIWGYFYSDDYHAPRIAAIKIPAKLHFIGTVGLANNATGSDGVTIRFGLKDLNDNVTWIGSKRLTTPGAYENWDINLSDYEGQKYYFVMRVDAGASPVNDIVIWNKARLMQVND